MAINPASDNVGGKDAQSEQVFSADDKTAVSEENHLEKVDTSDNHNLVYDHDDEEPELHARTYLAIAAMFALNLVQVVALQGPPAVVSNDGFAWSVQ